MQLLTLLTGPRNRRPPTKDTEHLETQSPTLATKEGI